MIPTAASEQVCVRWVPIKRFRCGDCGRTFGIFPIFLAILKRYAAQIIQSCWADWCEGQSCEEVSEAWCVRSVRTVQRWLRPLVRGRTRILSELHRLWQLEEPPEHSHPKRFGLLCLVRQAVQKSTKNQRATEYFHAQVVLRSLDR